MLLLEVLTDTEFRVDIESFTIMFFYSSNYGACVPPALTFKNSDLTHGAYLWGSYNFQNK
jgi:hypothetical protein